MRQRFRWLFFCSLGAVTAATLGHYRSSCRPTPVAVVVPTLEAEATQVVQWVDQGLLELAERDVIIEAREPPREREADEADASSLVEQRERIYRRLSFELGLTREQMERIITIFDASLYVGEGNPAVSVHPVTRAQCRERRANAKLARDDSRICGSANMVALYDPLTQEPGRAKLCMDQFEFPNLPCEFPLVWVRANEAAKLCRILDKRLCDAHEWEGACAGKLGTPGKEYESFVNRQLSELVHNQSRERVWATGFKPDARLCATGALKSPGCVDASWEACGTNSYPAGAFPRCVSPFGVYDLHGNVAEHMNLPLAEEQLGALGGSGETEMKGSWFAFDEYHPHPDDCRWRAPSWHSTPVESELSHYNYHLGFRCCKDLE